MPRRKAADRAGPVKTRSRSGCRECRASRVRCDTKKPVCTRCLEKGLPCSTNLVLKWESEFVRRGMAFGRTGVWSKGRADAASASASSASSPASSSDDTRKWCPLPAIHPWGFINSGMAMFEHPDQVDVALNEQRVVVPIINHHIPIAGEASAGQSPFRLLSIDDIRGLVAFNPAPSPSLSLFPGISEMGHTELFDYYLQQVCPRTTASSTVSSPFASVVLPFSLSASPTLFKAIQALAACHWSRADPVYSALGLRLKSETLRDLRRRLSREESSTYCTDPEILLIMMMLCLYEILDKCDQHWTIHLKGAKDLIRLRRQRMASLQESSSAPDPATDFAEHFFAFQDVMGRTACGEAVLFGSDYWKTDDRHIDLWMGCSPELVAILSAITEMSRARRQFESDSSRGSFSLRAASLEYQLENLVQEVGDGDDDILASGAEAKRLAALLYLHCALYGGSPTTPLVVEYVHRILRLVSDLLERGPMASVTWPVFVAAVELDPSRDEHLSGLDGKPVSGRSVVLRALAAMAESTISNITRTRAVIAQVWQARDQDLLKAPQMEGNDWEYYVAPISTSMSLA
ncbi:uncharacterized protein N7482_001682 [Penicillium canariense]|uniref:Zn(2)-C6 fungal-type domain-containing protein n=1 Tax=Penicillium canariense TaxID=189055 RepID=A0A9W9LTT2_9EURO|nr:uncharacterized protein N7482_001682 [Penicillium canariense]KAJ5175805.1 hypothetical protein N7482_001682 [Penicillium canariense]